MIEGYHIDDLKTTDRNGLLEIIKSGADNPYWYRNGQSDEAAADEHISSVKAVGAGQSNDRYKAIRTKEGRLIGCVVLYDFDRKTGASEIGYFLHRDYQGKGIGTEAVFAVVQSAVANGGLKTLQATIHPGKVASLKILLNLGLIVVGYQPEGAYPERDGSPAPRIVMKATEKDLAAALEKHVSSKRHSQSAEKTAV
jgi:RimJ/RimL family protein N-acetyltransferase